MIRLLLRHLACLLGIHAAGLLMLSIMRLALYVGCIAGLGSILLIGHVIYVKYIVQDAVPGWTTLAAAEFFLGGVELIGIGIVGEYVGRIFDEVKQRPLYIIREHIVKNGNSQ